ncbi:MAG: hypothetical protein KJ062_03435 [Thermoanaerobaculia bacterium]|nr:hypothetical protein [Thermoanaerobaculia bacterium]
MRRDRTQRVVPKRRVPAFTEDDLRDLYAHKVEFGQRVLGLSEAKAKEWADESVRAARSIEPELAHAS